MRVESDDEAVALMNDSAYGLTCALFTSDVARARDLSSRINTGTGASLALPCLALPQHRACP